MTLSNQKLNEQYRSHPERLAEQHTPTRYATLKHFLEVSLRPVTDIADIAFAVELDPVILTTFLGLHDGHIETIDRWFDGFDPALFPAIAMSMASNFLLQNQQLEETTHDIDHWKRSLLHSLLAEQIITQIDDHHVAQARLAGLLSNIARMLPDTFRSPQLPEVLLGSSTNAELHIAAHHSADLLKSLGCKSSFCDAVRYQHSPLERLVDTPALIKATAVASHLVEYIDEPDFLPDEIIEISSELGFNGNRLSDCIQIATQKLDEILLIETDVTCAGNKLRQVVDDAGLTAAFQGALSNAAPDSVEKLVRNSGEFLFSIDTVLHVQPCPPYLEVSLTGDETIRIPMDSTESIVATCYQDGQIQAILPENAGCVQDNQLLDRAGTEALLCLPLESENGVLAFGIDRNSVELSEKYPCLLAWYSGLVNNPVNKHSIHGSSYDQSYIDNHISDRINKLIHEVNNPFSIIQNYLHTLSVKLGKDSPLQKEIETISGEITRSSEILRSFREIDTRKESPFVETSVNDIVDRLVNIFRGSSKSIRFNLHLDDTVPAITTRPDDLKQILVNLIKNAVECFEDNKQNGNKPKITISTTGSVNVNGKQFVEIAISDNGPGIPADIQNRLFQPNITTKGPEHSGIGLSIVWNLADNVDAIISCKSREKNETPSGTTFNVLIPQ